MFHIYSLAAHAHQYNKIPVFHEVQMFFNIFINLISDQQRKVDLLRTS